MPTNLIHKLRALLFSPNSKLELWARTLYHRASQTRLYFNIQDWLARRSYRKWLKKREREPLPEVEPGKQPKITFLLDGKQRQPADLTITLESIASLVGVSPQVLLVASEPGGFDSITQNLSKNLDMQVITKSQTNLLDAHDGRFVIFCQAGDRFSPSLLKRFSLLLAEYPEVDLVYYDCEVQDPNQPSPAPVFKPPTPSSALCLSYNMFSRGLIQTERLKEILGQINPQDDLLLNEYTVCLKLLEANANFQHLPAVLVSQKKLVKPDSPQAAQVVLDHLSRSGLQSPSATNTPIGARFHWSHALPSLSVVIPTKNNAKLLSPLIQSLLDFKDQYSITINLVDNNSDDPKTLAYYDVIKSEPEIQLLPYQKPFNYSEAINLGVRASDSDLVLLMNDDIEPIDSIWLPEMIQWAQREDIGVVGAKLLRADHTLQHAGIILGLVGFAGHIYLNAPEDYFGLWGSADWYRDLLAVTGACQMMRRAVFDAVGGYDESFQLAFGDIDFCLRVHEQGYLNILTPFASLTHYEGRSRGFVTPVGDILRGYEQFEEYLTHPDPFFSPNLTYTRIPKCALKNSSVEDNRQQIEIRRAFYHKEN